MPPLSLPRCSFLRFPSSLPSLFRPRSRARSLRLCKHPPPLQSGQNSEGRGRRPPFPPVVGEGSAAAPGGGEYRGRLCAPPDQATRHTRGGGREAGLAERGVRPGQVRALAGPGRAPGAGSQVTTPRGAGGGPRFGRVLQPRVEPGAYNGRRGAEKTQSAAGLPGLLPPPPAPRGLLHEGAVETRTYAVLLPPRCAPPGPGSARPRGEP